MVVLLSGVFAAAVPGGFVLFLVAFYGTAIDSDERIQPGPCRGARKILISDPWITHQRR
jgi:hypothetical protein